MNKRREPMTPRLEKQERKEVRKGMKEETIAAPKLVKVARIETVMDRKHLKKHSKRTASSEKLISNAAPAHCHTENEHWAHCVSSQNLLRASRLRKKLSKQPSSRGRLG